MEFFQDSEEITMPHMKAKLIFNGMKHKLFLKKPKTKKCHFPAQKQKHRQKNLFTVVRDTSFIDSK